jgi:thiol-disulfide isomerase/thioredoxin
MKIKFAFTWLIFLVFNIRIVAAINLPSIVQTKQEGYQITVQSKESKSKRVYLGNFYGKFNQYVDSVVLDTNGNAIFKANTKLSSGIYFLQDHRKIQLLDFIVANDDQQIVIEEINYQTASYKVQGGNENLLYSAYNEFVRKAVPEINQYRAELLSAKSKADSIKIQSKIQAKTQSIDQYRINLIKEQPSSLLAQFFIAMERPKLPSPLPKALLSQPAQLAYFKMHYWDGINFANPAFIKTPFFEPKLEEFFKYYVSPTVDSIIPIVDHMLADAKPNADMYFYLLSKFSNKFMNPAYLGQDKVFVHLYQNYYLKGDTILLNAKDKKTIIQTANKLIANQLGVKAANFDLIDMNGNPQSLYSIVANYSFIVFWDPTCDVCQKELPRVDSIYKASWYKYGVKIITVNNEAAHEGEWRKYLAEHDFKNWINLYEPVIERESRIKKGLEGN